MRKLLFVVAVIVALGFVKPAMAQNDSKGSVYLGYAYDYSRVSFTECDSSCEDPSDGFNFNGGIIEGEYKFNSSLGLVAAFAGAHTGSNGADFNDFTYTFGPRYSFGGGSGKYTPFVEALFGGAHASGNGLSANAFAMGLGGGIDIKLTDHWFVRPVEATYTLTTFNFGAGSSTIQNGFGYSAGFGYRF